jgi:hypothetical protein
VELSPDAGLILSRQDNHIFQLVGGESKIVYTSGGPEWNSANCIKESSPKSTNIGTKKQFSKAPLEPPHKSGERLLFPLLTYVPELCHKAQPDSVL